MLDKIKKNLFAKYQPTDIRWLFLSTFSKDDLLISSNGTLEPEKNLEQLVELLYHGIIEKETNVKKIAIDIVLESTQETDMQQLQALNLQENGLCLVGEQGKSGTILPNTQGVVSIQQALTLVKDKYQLTGNATIYAFKTERLVVGG